MNEQRTVQITDEGSCTVVRAYLPSGRLAWRRDFPDPRAAKRAADRWLEIRRSDLARMFAHVVDSDDLPF